MVGVGVRVEQTARPRSRTPSRSPRRPARRALRTRSAPTRARASAYPTTDARADRPGLLRPPRARVRRLLDATLSDVDEQWAPTVLATDRAGVYKRWFRPRSSRSSAAATSSSPAPGSSSSARRGEPRPRPRRAPARQRGLPTLPRGRLPDRPTTRVRRSRRPARLPVRARAGPRRGRDRPALAGAGRAHPPPLARARRGGVLRALLLRIRDALLPGSEPERPRRPSRDPCRGGALRVVARGRAAAARPRAGRHGRAGRRGQRSSASADSRTPSARATSSTTRSRSRSPIRPARAAGSTTRTNRARLGKALTHVRRELAPDRARRRVGSPREHRRRPRRGLDPLHAVLPPLLRDRARRLRRDQPPLRPRRQAISSNDTGGRPRVGDRRPRDRGHRRRPGSRARSSTPCRTHATAPSTRRSARCSRASRRRSSRCSSPDSSRASASRSGSSC